MIAPADRAVAERDPALPLHLVLDDDALLAHLVARWPDPTPPESVRVTYLRYKPGVLVEAAVAVRFVERVELAAMLAVAPDADAKLAKAVELADRRAPGLPVVHDRATRLALLPLRTDRRLKGLERIDDPAWLGGALAGATIEPLAYKPGRRLVARVTGSEGPCGVLRLYSAARWPGPAEAFAWSAKRGLDAPRLPALLAKDGRHRAVLSEWLPGERVDQCPGAAGRYAEARAGEAVAQLHAAKPRRLRPFDELRPADEALVDAVAAVEPALADVARAALRHKGAAPPRIVPLHGDLSRDQVLLGPQGIALIDLDRLSAGAPEEDLAAWGAARVADPNGVADPEDLDPRRRDPEAVVEAAIGTEFYAAYRAAGGRGQLERVRAVLPRALLTRAVTPFRMRDPQWARRLEDLVALAARLADASA